VIVIDGVVVRAAGEGADERIDGVARQRRQRIRVAPEILRDRLADEQRHADPAPPGPELQLFVVGSGKAQVGRDRIRHFNTTISRYRTGRKRLSRAARRFASPAPVAHGLSDGAT
jgi:hypothetical protein